MLKDFIFQTMETLLKDMILIRNSLMKYSQGNLISKFYQFQVKINLNSIWIQDTHVYFFSAKYIQVVLWLILLFRFHEKLIK